MFLFGIGNSVPISLCNDSSKVRKAMKFRFLLSLAMVLTLATAVAQAKNYTKIVVFGDSLSDTGNVAHLSEVKCGFRVPGTAADYTDGRLPMASIPYRPRRSISGCGSNNLQLRCQPILK